LRLLGIDRWWPANPLTGAHLRRPLDDTTTVEADQPAGACLLVRRAAVEAVGGWDERYWFWYEDVDFSRRLARDAGVTLYVPSAAFRHLGGATTLRWSLPDQHRRTYYGMLLYAQTHLGRAGQVLVAATMGTVCLLRLALAGVRRGGGGAVYRGCLTEARALAGGRPVRRIAG
jgi:GT2 family glycosyltransferase